MAFVLFSECVEKKGAFPTWVRGPRIRHLHPGDRQGDVVVLDRNSAAQAFATTLARRRFGASARAMGVQTDGTPQGCAGAFYVAHICKTYRNGCYVGEEIRFLVVDK